MRDGSFYDKLSALNNYLYKNFGKDYQGWKVLDTHSTNSGVNICVFNISNETLFAIRGTEVFTRNVQEIKRDFTADGAMVAAKIPRQYKHAEEYYESIKDKYPNIIFTGYSLGGSIAQMLGGKYGNETITFEPYGTRGLQNPIYDKNIINFGNTLDIIFLTKLKDQVGLIYVMPITKQHVIYPKDTPGFRWHIFPNYGKPSEAEPYKLIRDRITDYVKNGIFNNRP